MKRTPIQRKTGLAPGKPLERTPFKSRPKGCTCGLTANPMDSDEVCRCGSSRREWTIRAGEDRVAQRKPLARNGRIKPVSTKRAAENRKRRVVLQELAEQDPWCTARIPDVCEGRVVDGDEITRRSQGGSITDPANIQLLCRACHRVKTEAPTWAVDNGLARWGMRTNPEAGDVA